MIDLHSHILPGIDDGAEDLSESLRMAQAAVDEGIRTIIATPHHANGRYDNPAADIFAVVKALNDELQNHSIPLDVLYGQEIRIYSDLLEDLDKHHVLTTLNSSPYILIELPGSRIPAYTSELLHELLIMNKIPIIAHPERNAEIVADPEILLRWVQLGALSQLTAHSINGRQGKKLQRICLNLCRQHLVHFIASDAHNTTTRPFGLRQAYEEIEAKLGSEYAEYYQNNAQLVVNSESIRAREPRLRKRRWYSFRR